MVQCGDPRTKSSPRHAHVLLYAICITSHTHCRHHQSVVNVTPDRWHIHQNVRRHSCVRPLACCTGRAGVCGCVRVRVCAYTEWVRCHCAQSVQGHPLLMPLIVDIPIVWLPAMFCLGCSYRAADYLDARERNDRYGTPLCPLAPLKRLYVLWLP